MVVVSPDVFFNSDSFLFLILIILLLQLRERKVSMARLLIMPIIITMLAIPFFYTTASSGWFGFSLVILGLLVGLVLGVFLGSLMEVKLRERWENCYERFDSSCFNMGYYNHHQDTEQELPQ